MEKFGIFNILSALGSLTGNKNDTRRAEQTPQNAPSPPRNTFTPPRDVFTPPEYPAYKPMLDFMQKHDEISRRIDKNNIPKK